MTCREMFIRDHPKEDPERAVLEACPHDFGIKPTGGALCLGAPILQDCRKCWEQEAVEE